MKYQGCLLAVRDIAVSQRFYETVLHQKAVMELGEHITFAGFSLQQGYAALAGVAEDCGSPPSHSFQLYFEVEDLDRTYGELQGIAGLQWVHTLREYPWGQRDLRIYDPDKHIIEIAEEMGTVIRRFFAQGMSADEVAARTMFPIEAVKPYAPD